MVHEEKPELPFRLRTAGLAATYRTTLDALRDQHAALDRTIVALAEERAEVEERRLKVDAAIALYESRLDLIGKVGDMLGWNDEEAECDENSLSAVPERMM